MVERGIDNPDDLLCFASADAILGACAWWDDRPGSGPGLLATVIRSGGKPGYRTRRQTVAGQHEYADRIMAWIRRHFPDLGTDHSTHPAAVLAVLYLHDEHGKGSLTVDEHGPRIRAFVARWDREHGIKELAG